MKKLKRLLLRLAAAAAAVFMLLGAKNGENGEYDWFFKPSGHEQPLCLGGSSLPGEYGALYLGSPDEKVIYLTFDAGYDNGNVTRVAGILRENSVTAAFFILPEMARSHSELLLALAEDGNLLCNHSSTHRNMAKVTEYELFEQEITECEMALYENTGLTMAKYFRPPEGSFSVKTLEFCKKSGYVPVFWSFAYADWDNSRQKDAEWAYEKIMSNVHNGMVMLLHPTSATNAAILDRVIKDLKAQGYRFGTLDELNFYAKTGGALYGALPCTYAYEGGAISDNGGEKRIALTFDDGPHPRYTDMILDILGKYNVKATFFVIGKNAELYPVPLERAIREGHEIGCHTYSHLYYDKCGFEQYTEDIAKAQDLLSKEFGVTPAFFRPPGGKCGEKLKEWLNKAGLRCVLWSWRTDARDWASPSAESVAKCVLSTVRGGDIVLLHDYVSGNSPTPRALEIIIPELIAQGYGFVTLSELFS